MTLNESDISSLVKPGDLLEVVSNAFIRSSMGKVHSRVLFPGSLVCVHSVKYKLRYRQPFVEVDFIIATSFLSQFSNPSVPLKSMTNVSSGQSYTKELEADSGQHFMHDFLKYFTKVRL